MFERRYEDDGIVTRRGSRFRDWHSKEAKRIREEDGKREKRSGERSCSIAKSRRTVAGRKRKERGGRGEGERSLSRKGEVERRERRRGGEKEETGGGKGKGGGRREETSSSRRREQRGTRDERDGRGDEGNRARGRRGGSSSGESGRER